MDQRERQGDRQEMLLTAMDALQARLWTQLPGIIDSFDPAKLTASVQPAIQGQTQDKQTGAWTSENLPLLILCPVLFPNGGGFALTFPIKKGDECIIFFSKSCMDAWWQNGGVQPQSVYRVHDLSDGFVLVGPRSQANLLSGYDPDKVQLRNEAGDTFIEMDGDQLVTITAPGGINLNGVTIDSDGNITTPGDVVAGGDEISLINHTHDVEGVQTGSSTVTSNEPNP